jgi:hypothetical protein
MVGTKNARPDCGKDPETTPSVERDFETRKRVERLSPRLLGHRLIPRKPIELGFERQAGRKVPGESRSETAYVKDAARTGVRRIIAGQVQA